MTLCSSLWLAAHLWSIHAAPVPNDRTFGAGLECDNPYVAVQAGYFHNSLGNASEYLVFGKDFGTEHWKVGGFAGAATGYDIRPCCSSILGARFTGEFGRFRAQVLLLPPGGVGRPANAHLMLEWRL